MYYAELWDTKMGKMVLKVMIAPTLSAHRAPDPVLDAMNTVVIIAVKVNFVTELILVRETTVC